MSVFEFQTYLWLHSNVQRIKVEFKSDFFTLLPWFDLFAHGTSTNVFNWWYHKNDFIDNFRLCCIIRLMNITDFYPWRSVYLLYILEELLIFVYTLCELKKQTCINYFVEYIVSSSKCLTTNQLRYVILYVYVILHSWQRGCWTSTVL